MPREQHAELVHAHLDVLGAQLAAPLLQPPALARQLVDRQHGVVARVVGVVHGGAVGDALALAHGEVVGDGDRLAVRDEEAVVRALERRPAAHAGAGPRPVEVDRGIAAVAVVVAVGGEVALVGAPAQLRRLAALAREPLHGPRVDELAGALRRGGDLRVALGDVDHLDAQAMGEPGPAGAVVRLAACEATGRARDVEQRLLREVRHEPGIHAVGEDGGGRGPGPAQGERLLAQAVVRTLRGRLRGVVVAALPRLDAGVEVQDARLAGTRR